MEHQDADSEQSKYDKKVEDIKAKLTIKFKHENFKYQISKDPVCGNQVTGIILYNHNYIIRPDTTWDNIKKFICAAVREKSMQTLKCDTCESNNIKKRISCKICSGSVCINCYEKILLKSKGTITCPCCNTIISIDEQPHSGVEFAIYQMKYEQQQLELNSLSDIELQHYANEYNKLPLLTGIVNIKEIGFLKILYKYINNSNPIAYKIGRLKKYITVSDGYIPNRNGYELDDIVGAAIITDVSGKKYKIDKIAWNIINDIYKIYMIKKIFCDIDLLPVKIDFSQNICKSMADLSNYVGYSQKILTYTQNLIKDVPTFMMFTHCYKQSDLHNYAKTQKYVCDLD